MTERQRLARAVDAFAAKMKAKLLEKLNQGWSGWRERYFIEPRYGNQCCHKLIDHALELYAGDFEQAVDVANLAMFIDHYHSRKRRKATDE